MSLQQLNEWEPPKKVSAVVPKPVYSASVSDVVSLKTIMEEEQQNIVVAPAPVLKNKKKFKGTPMQLHQVQPSAEKQTFSEFVDTQKRENAWAKQMDAITIPVDTIPVYDEPIVQDYQPWLPTGSFERRNRINSRINSRNNPRNPFDPRVNQPTEAQETLAELVFNLYHGPRIVVAGTIAMVQSISDDIIVTNFKTGQPYNRDTMLNINDAFFYFDRGGKRMYADFREIFGGSNRMCYLEAVKNQTLNLDLNNYTIDDNIVPRVRAYLVDV